MRTKFLIVDDSDLVRKGLRALLQTNPGWKVCGEAPDGMTALKMLKELHPNVVIVDFQMPGMDGIEVARRMLELEPGVPIVMFTQHANSDLERQAQKAGIRSVVSKSDAFPMIGILENLVGHSRAGKA